MGRDAEIVISDTGASFVNVTISEDSHFSKVSPEPRAEFRRGDNVFYTVWSTLYRCYP